MQSLLRSALAATLVVSTSAPALAQAGHGWAHGTSVAAVVGAATSASDPGPVVGGALAWDLTPRVAVEGAGTWLDRGHGADAFNAALKVRGHWRQQGTSPFVEAGFGLYRLSVNPGADLPGFYARRMSANGAGLATRAFTDPVLHLGAGLTFAPSRHLALQPAFETMLVTRDSRTHTLLLFSLRMAWRFEDRPVTPARVK